MTDSPESVEGDKNKTLISGQPVTMWTQRGDKYAPWIQKSGDAEFYICRDKSESERKWLLVVDSETKANIIQEEVGKLPVLLYNSIVWWTLEPDFKFGIKIENFLQAELLKDYLKGDKQIRPIHRSKITRKTKTVHSSQV